MSSTYNVINASAGSGKTYELVLRLLALCLKYPNQEQNIRHILALTFTNKAANEMKKRILDWLESFTKDDYQQNPDLKNIQLYLKEEEEIQATLEDLHQRAQKVLDYILHHYSTLNVGTIDKFNSRLVRNFSYELGLAKNFNLEIQPEPYLIEAVDQMLDQIGSQNELSETFLDFVTYNLDNNERISLSNTLYKTAKEFVKDKHYFQLQENKDFSWDCYQNSKDRLREEIQTLRESSIKNVDEVLALLQENNLEVTDFAGGKSNGIGKFFFEAKKYFNKTRADLPLPTNETSAMDRFMQGASTSAKHKQAEIEDILEILLASRTQIINNYINSEKKKMILKGLLPLKINKEIQDQLAVIEEENDLVLLSKFNILIHENLRQEPSAFIYEKVGTQFNHYFFDEFQDTSRLQWQNFLPLRDHTITSEKSSFTLVGDPKQSIYSFRGGDSQLMLDILNNKEVTPVKRKLKILGNNWRSATHIVDFNNRLYLELSKNLSPDYQTIFGADAQQTAKSKNLGRIRINLLENSSKDEFFEEAAHKMQNDIQACLDRGYHLSDITILCRGNNDILNFSRILGTLKVQYQHEEIFLKTISEKGLTLEFSSTLLGVMAYLEWHNNPQNTQALVSALYYLQNLGRISMPHFTLGVLEVLHEKTKDQIEIFLEKTYGLSVRQDHLTKLNLYHFVEFFVLEFSVEGREVDFVLNFLEMVYNYSQNAGLTVKDFLKYWQEEGKSLSIQGSENMDAIQLMTIHKAKGLEFPIVFLPMRNTGTSGSKLNGWWETNEADVQSIEASPLSEKIRAYDPEMEEFYERLQAADQLDQFCIQYVATTRAVDQMYFYLEKPNKSSNHLKILDFISPLEKFNPDQETDPQSFDLYEVKEEMLFKNQKEEKSTVMTQTLDCLETPTAEKTSIKIATPSKNYQEKNKKVKMGIFTHEILSKISGVKDIPLVLESYVLAGTITREEGKEIEQSLQKVLTHEKYAAYFKEGLQVLTEREIMISEGGVSVIYRPDRMIKTPEGYIIIDFKTGDKMPKHQKQLDIYQQALEKLGKKVLKTELLYLDLA